ncbi:thiazolylpeptide-type bacteriocin [Plantactinospora sp. KLBMP9567]|uniref:thiazolylpeptide-type bacteriocin n=1 Tax=Plantactinospora sp. KLBMP9567 TaxID=3085900 RepID=UPI002982B216|nr:thiazolylpeptide-type bacteriocin [Plantactinospora sp. KLBMP9567]MDW5326598.1 thiazolylpeptide-type bacteriocin [Plantactinospora sp. KLBMP9567]
MNAQHDLDLLAEEILALETETFAISDYADVTEAVLASTSCSSTTSTTSATTSSTSCSA